MAERIFLFLAVTLIFLVAPKVSSAQNKCEVFFEVLEGNYEGECKKGKAHGLGKAEGIDVYNGSFRRGYPHGQGVYTWKNGNRYTGGFSSGVQDGEGELIIKRRNRADSVLTGYWKAGKYIGKYPYAYKVLYRQNITNVRFRRMGEGNGLVDIKIRRNGNNVVMSSIDALALSEGTNVAGPDGLPRFEQIKFPFTAVIDYITPAALAEGSPIIGKLEFEIYQEGRWDIIIETF